MTGADKLRIFLRRLGLAEASFLAMCAEAGHRVSRLEDLPLPAAHDPLDVYYAISSVADRLEFSEKTVRRRLFAGEFGPTEAVLLDGEHLRVPYSGLHFYLRRHQLDRGPAILQSQRELMQRRLGRERGDFIAGVPARSEGELRRKVQASGQEAANG
jgi:hypothetical protein